MDDAYTSVTSALGCTTNRALKRRVQARLWRTQLLTPWRLKEMKDKQMEHFRKQWQEGFVLPGLLCCINGCTHMVVQGICIVENDLFITAYCSCGKKHAVRGFSDTLFSRRRVLDAQEDLPSAGVPHASVVFVLDKSTGEYKKTVLLANHDHVGGIAFYREGTQGYIVLTRSAGKEGAMLERYQLDGFLQATDGSVINDYVSHTDLIPLKLERASFVSYCEAEHSLYAGCFCSTGHGSMQKIKLDGAVWISDNSYRNTMKITEPLLQGGLLDKMQGCTFDELSVFISCSYGWRHNSVLSRHFIKNGIIEEAPVEAWLLPPYLEGIALDRQQKRMYCIFESGADLYAWKTPSAIDRVVILQLSGKML